MLDRHRVIPVHEQLEQLLRHRIRTGDLAPGDKLPPEPELARHYEVSRNTLRTVLAKLAEAGLVQRRRAKGTFVCRPAALEATDKWVGLLLEHDISHPDLSPFWLRLIQKLRRRLEEQSIPCRFYAGHRAPLSGDYSVGTTCKELLLDLKAGCLVGLFSIGLVRGRRLTELLHQQGVVTVGGEDSHGTDYAALTDLAVQHLHAAGCRRVALMSLAKPDGSVTHPEHFRRALDAHGLPCCESWIVGVRPTVEQPHNAADAFHGLWRSASEPPDGLVVLDEAIYRQLEPALLHSRLQIPSDLHVVTHFNRGDARLPLLPVTRIEVDAADIAAGFADDLLARLRQNPAPPRPSPAPLYVVETNAPPLPSFLDAPAPTKSKRKRRTS